MTDSLDFHWRDDAIKRDDEDLFDRGPTADRMSNLIVNAHSWDSSVIFGLTGPWGSGKSSLINLATNRIITRQPDWRVVQFTPWATGDASGLLEEFYRSIAQALPPAWGAKFRRTAGMLAQVAAPTANLIPIVGGTIADAAKGTGAWLAAAPPWQAAFDRAARELRDANTPILVVADDIDRLQTDELLLFLKVIRLLGRFPGVQYLIAYDEKTLYRTLGAANLVTDTESATRYMEKIVQYPISVPPLLEYQLQSRVIEGIERVREQAKRPPLTGHNWNVLLTSLLPLTRTPRAVDRFLAQVAHDLPILDPTEINDTDLLLLIAFRQQFPTVASQLPDWKERLIHGHTGEMVMDGSPWSYEPTKVLPLLQGLSEAASDAAHVLLRALFPNLEGDSIGRSSPTGGRHITDLTYFDRYFSLGIPENDIPDSVVRDAVDAARDGRQEALVALLSTGGEHRAGLALTKATGMTTDASDVQATLKLVRAGATAIAALPDQTLNSGFGVRDRTVYWLADLVANVAPLIDLGDIKLATEPLSALDTIRILSAARSRRPFESWAWEEQLTSDLTTTLIDEFIENVLQRDGAPEALTTSMLAIAIENGRVSEVRSRLNGALSQGQINLGDVAARLVIAAIGAGEQHWRLHAVEQGLWESLAIGSGDDPWYDEPVLDHLDLGDLSSPNRRRYAQGRFRPPSNPSLPND